jgi:outer membrane biogenesis lipoprotein LolB
MCVRQAVAALSLLAISGCAVNSQTQVPDRSVIAQATLATKFSLSGRFSAKNGSEQVSGQFRYSQQGESRTLNLFSPLGTPLADIVVDRATATLTQANGATQSAASLSDLLRTVIDLPVTDATLSAWLQGLPSAAAAPAVLAASGTERDASGLPSRFVESGWEIVISARMEGADASATATTTAPKRMRWSLLGQPDTEVRWVIDEWRVQ